MQEVFEKIIDELEKLADELYKAYCIGFNSDDRAEYDAYINAIEIVKQESEQYNGGWIPCSEQLPEEKENPITQDYLQYPVMVNISGTLDLRYYYYGNGHWRIGLQIMDKYVTHWMDIKPYQPKGE